MADPRIGPGSIVVYALTKSSKHPGPRAREVTPASCGDEYTYVVDKLWRVIERRGDGSLLLRTPRGKQRVVDADDPLLRRAGWFDRLRFRDRIASLLREDDEEGDGDEPDGPVSSRD